MAKVKIKIKSNNNKKWHSQYDNHIVLARECHENAFCVSDVDHEAYGLIIERQHCEVVNNLIGE